MFVFEDRFASFVNEVISLYKAKQVNLYFGFGYAQTRKPQILLKGE